MRSVAIAFDRHNVRQSVFFVLLSHEIPPAQSMKLYFPSSHRCWNSLTIVTVFFDVDADEYADARVCSMIAS
jgi:hypothetical protein